MKRRGLPLFSPPQLPGEVIFSPDRVFRYFLWRVWDLNKPTANFLMLNCSTADENKNDPTVDRTEDYAKRWGCGSVKVTNLFAFRATEPEDMKRAADPIGPENDYWILRAALGSEKVICAWGNHGSYRGRAEQVVGNLRGNGVRLYYLKMNGSGQPSHPLYLPSALLPVELPLQS